MSHVNRFAVYWLSQDGEPELVARAVAFFPTLNDAQAFGTEYASDTYGGYVAIKDRETDIWIEE